MNFLAKIFGKTEKTRSALGVDIGSSSLKVVQLSRKNGAIVLETYGELSLGPYGKVEIGQATNLPADTIATTLIDLLHEANVTTNDCGVSIPASRSLLTFTELPRRDNPEEQKTVIELEARKYIPVPISEVHLDWFVLPDVPSSSESETKTPLKNINVLLVAVHNDEIQLLDTVVKKANLAATFFEIEIFSTIRSVVDETVKPIMIIDIGSASTKVYIVERGVVATSHAIPHGGQDVTRAISASSGIDIAHAEQSKKEEGITGAEQGEHRIATETTFSNIFAEAKRVMLQFEHEKKRSVTAIVLTGGGGVTKGLGEYAQNFFAVETRVADPFAKTQAPEFIRPVLKEIGPEFSVAVGIALRKLEEFN
ncbi:MAG TPA: type IV pilus assembly protein PilM [Candidatus Kaiserbacteria bacterium]|nr:type IV pilus assembly protein PilM [Candidatus Kaiserbacteria bacterium]